MDWGIRRSFNRYHFSGKSLVVFTTGGSHSWQLPKSLTRQSHRSSRRGSFGCQRSALSGHLLVTNASTSFHRWSQRSPPCQPSAQCFCPPSERRHLSCAVPSNDQRHGRRRWRSRWWSAVHWGQSSRPIRRTEAVDCLRWRLDHRGRRWGFSRWWLAEDAMR